FVPIFLSCFIRCLPPGSTLLTYTTLFRSNSKLPGRSALGRSSCLKVSIITAVYNGESEIVRTLDSVAAQDYRDIEHIIVDGHSRDRKSTRLNSSHEWISYAVFCLKKKKNT